MRCWLLVDNLNIIFGCYVGFWVHFNVHIIFQKMWTILSKLKDNCLHFLGSLEYSLECNSDISCYIGCWNMWVATLVVGTCWFLWMLWIWNLGEVNFHKLWSSMLILMYFCLIFSNSDCEIFMLTYMESLIFKNKIITFGEVWCSHLYFMMH